MISANQLPNPRSVYEAPPLLPGQELTEEQKKQALTAQIAGIIVGVAVTKSSLQAAVTNQIVALLHAADLTTTVGIKAFAKAAASIVRLATQQAQEITWTGVKMRTEAVGVPFEATMPDPESLPDEVRYGRATNLEKAYERLAEEYKKNLERDKDDPVIRELVAQYEDEMVTPLPRPDNISSDAVERIADGKAEWTEAFQEASEAEGGADPEGPSDEEIAEASLAERRRRAEEERAKELEEFASAVEAAKSDRKRQADAARADIIVKTGGLPEFSEKAAGITLTDAEIASVIERYAEHKVGERAERMVSQDIAGASRNIYKEALKSLPKADVIGYRRVVHPELSQSGHSCGLCIVASTMVYTRGDLLPIHSGCNCEVCEIYSVGDELYDPGHMINLEDLEVFYREAGNSTHGWDLKKGKYKVVNHPEYGPTLVNAHPNKRGKIKKEYIPING